MNIVYLIYPMNWAMSKVSSYQNFEKLQEEISVTESEMYMLSAGCNIFCSHYISSICMILSDLGKVLFDAHVSALFLSLHF